jgi:hypothetical protein
MERGCEGSSHIAFGKYKILKNNIVHFQFQPFDSIKPIREINRHQHKRDSSVMISFYDRNEQPLTFCSIEVVDINGKVTNLFTDIKGQVVFKQRLYKQIMLASIPAIFSKAEYILVGDETSIEVHLALPDLFLIYPDIAVENYEDFQMIIKKDGLYDLEKKTLIYKFSK